MPIYLKILQNGAFLYIVINEKKNKKQKQKNMYLCKFLSISTFIKSVKSESILQ